MIATLKQNKKPKIRLPYPHQGQQFIRNEAKRFNWLSAGRRWRKTTMAMSIVVEAASRGGVYIWGAPTFDQVRVGYGETKKALGNLAIFNQSRMTVEIPGAGTIIYRSLDNPDNARGHTANGIVIDEVGVIKEEAWREVLRPMLIDTDGWAWMIGTPKGRNWFYTEWHNASDDNNSAAWQVPTLGVTIKDGKLMRDPHLLENPYIPFEEIKRLYETLPEKSFRQEVLAEFIENSGSVFRNVRACAIAEPTEKASDNGQYIIGIDWGKSADFSVFTVLDVSSEIPRVVYLDRFNQIDYQVQLGRLMALCERFDPYSIIAEQNSIGVPLIEQLQRQGLPVQPFMTTNASKTQAIDALALAFERSEIEIINDPVLVGELQAYEMEQLPSGAFRYNAPAGMHDDCVMSLALAYSGVHDRRGLLLWQD